MTAAQYINKDCCKGGLIYMACRHGGIGRRAGLKIPFPQGSAGSTPAAGSGGAVAFMQQLFCCRSIYLQCDRIYRRHNILINKAAMMAELK